MVSPTINVMVEAVRKAGRALIRDFGEVENLQVSKKGPGDFVTASDLRAEKILIDELKKTRPSYNFLTEESGKIAGTSDEFTWVIDPIDGTTNFMHGIPYFCISLALIRKNKNGIDEIIAGVIYSPIINDLIYAEKNGGTFLNDRRVVVSSRKTIQDSLIAGYYWKDKKEELDEKDINCIKEIASKSMGLRSCGSAALDLAYVACGKLDAFWHYNLKPWDIAAGILMVTESKGIVSEIKTSDGVLKSGNLVAANSVLHDKFVSLLNVK